MIERTKKCHQEIVLMHSKCTDTELYHPQQAKSKTFGKGVYWCVQSTLLKTWRKKYHSRRINKCLLENLPAALLFLQLQLWFSFAQATLRIVWGGLEGQCSALVFVSIGGCCSNGSADLYVLKVYYCTSVAASRQRVKYRNSEVPNYMRLSCIRQYTGETPLKSIQGINLCFKMMDCFGFQ